MTASQARVLIVDDETIVRESLGDYLREHGYSVDLAADGPTAVEMVARGAYHMVVLDIRMPGMDGIETLREIKARRPDLPVLMITAYADVSTAVASMKAGAYDYVLKPFDPDELAMSVRNVVTHQNLLRENLALRRKLEERERFDEMIGRAPLMRAVFDTISAVADTNVTVLIRGESGTGKEMVARTIHTRSNRASGPFIAINCGALPETLIESELFGHERGAFTGAVARRKGRFELANGGTLLLDEIGEMAPKMQVELLRVIETRQFVRVGGTETVSSDVRIVAATNRDLLADVKAGRFREDLYYRLNVVTVLLPPLRDRREDIPLLAEHFLRHHAKEMGRPARAFSPDALALLLAYDWPGNVRELANAVERAVAIGKTELVSPADLSIDAPEEVVAGTGKTLREIERRQVAAILDECGWNITRAAETLGIDRVTLYNKMRRYGIQRPEPQ